MGRNDRESLIRVVRESNARILDYEETAAKKAENSAKKRYRNEQLHSIIKSYIKLYIEKEQKKGISNKDIAKALYSEKVINSTVGKAKLDVYLKDTAAKKENKMQINESKNDLTKTFIRFYPEEAKNIMEEILNQDKDIQER